MMFKKPFSQVPVKELTDWAKLHALAIYKGRIDAYEPNKEIIVVRDAL